MKTKFFFLLTAATIFLTGCQTTTQTNQNTVNQTNVSASGNNAKPILTEKGVFTVELKTAPAELKAGEKIDLSFIVKNSSGELVRDLQIVHEKPMHLLIVSDDLSEFYHEHPEPQADGSHKVSFAFPNGGNYKLYADLTPQGAVQLVQDFSVKVGGNERAAKELVTDANFEKTNENLRIVMKPSGDLISEQEMTLDFAVFDAATNQPVTDLENYLGEKAHFVVISRDLQEFVHAHPMSTENAKAAEHAHAKAAPHKHDDKIATSAASTVSAHITFPTAATYRLWAQFKRAGKVITVPFTFDVKQGAASETADLSKVNFPENAIKVIVSKDGFTPEEISFSKGQPVKLAFYRVDAENCGSEVVFKELNIRKKLPVGEVVTVDIPTGKSGEFSFACGMDMYRGKIVVQ
jgi:hypothetical protein